MQDDGRVIYRGPHDYAWDELVHTKRVLLDELSRLDDDIRGTAYSEESLDPVEALDVSLQSFIHEDVMRIAESLRVDGVDLIKSIRFRLFDEKTVSEYPVDESQDIGPFGEVVSDSVTQSEDLTAVLKRPLAANEPIGVSVDGIA